MKAVSMLAPAKVNLWLRVLAREASGYHGLETLFCALELADELRVSRGGEGIRLRVEGGFDTGPDRENLVVRAARRFLAEVHEEGTGLSIELRKRIPVAAGLGGGSSDAAATLRALNRLLGDPLSDDTLLQLSIELGSDVPFFLSGSPLALGWSRGERLLALPALPVASVLVAHPGEPMPTAGAFHRIAQLRGGEYRPQASRIPAEVLTRWDTIAERAINDFGPVAIERVPKLAEGLDALRGAGARIALLAGSGASIFGIFDAHEPPSAAAAELRALGFTVQPTRTLTSMPEALLEPASAG